MSNNPAMTTDHAAMSVMAPPQIDDLEWKHLIQEIGASLGIDTVSMWIAGGLIAFFLFRTTLTKTVLEGQGELQKYTTIAYLSKIPKVGNASGHCIVHLLHESFSEEVKKLCAQMLLVVGQSARLLEYEETWTTTTNAIVCCLLSVVIWLVFKSISPSHGNIIYVEALILILAWAPTGFLAFFLWRWEELRRSGVKLAKKLDSHTSSLAVAKKK